MIHKSNVRLWNSVDIEDTPQINKMDSSKPKLKVADSEGRIEENDDLEPEKKTDSTNEIYFCNNYIWKYGSKSKCYWNWHNCYSYLDP